MSRSAAVQSPLRRGVLGRCGLYLALLVAFWSTAAPAHAIKIEFRFPDDPLTASFFGTAANPTLARTTLEFAARTFTPFTDTLSAIQPGGNNTWTAQYVDPSTGFWQSVSNPTVPQDTVVIYAIARNLLGAALGQASVGTQSFGNNASASFRSAVLNRGQGNPTSDFAAWGGVLAVDVQNIAGAPRNWHYDLNSQPAVGEYDFYTMATHELAHLFGFGVSTSYISKLQNNEYFTGAVATEMYGGFVPVYAPPPEPDQPQQLAQHWAPGVTSPPFRPETQPKPSLGPSLTLGERKLFTPLDYAALADIGWEVPPELLGLPADFNGDAAVDGADFLIWQRGYGGFGGTPGDANGDLRVDEIDGWIVSNYLGSKGVVPGSLATASALVPEPAGVSLTIIGLFALATHGRRRRHSIMNDVTISSCSHAKPK